MNLVAISDIHGHHHKLRLPPATFLTVSGDFCSYGSLKEAAQFMGWLTSQAPNYKAVIVVAGNHDKCMESMGAQAAKQFVESYAPNIHYLQDSSCLVEGVRFYGSPFTPAFGDEWAFQLHTEGQTEAKWGQIPERIDVLITHGPPKGILDKNLDDEECGCPVLAQRIIEVKPAIHIFGHIHLGGGRGHSALGTNYYNASVCDERYKAVQPLTIIDLPEFS